MALVHELENSGNWLFRRRSWLPAFLIVIAVIVMYLENRQAILFDRRDEIIFLAVALLGQAIRIVTIGYTPRNTSGRNTVHGQVADELNTTGIYSVVRHPLYLGNFFMWLGPVLFLRSFEFTVFFILFYWLYYERIMFAEEQFLRRKFGEIYDEWSARVKPFIPFSFSYIPPKLGFSLRNVLKREYNSFVNIFIVFLILDLFRNYFLSGRVWLTGFWLWLSAAAILIWIVLRTLSKKTRIFEVEGR